MDYSHASVYGFLDHEDDAARSRSRPRPRPVGYPYSYGNYYGHNGGGQHTPYGDAYRFHYPTEERIRPYSQLGRSRFRGARNRNRFPPRGDISPQNDHGDVQLRRLNAQLMTAEAAYQEEKSLGDMHPETHGTVAPMRLERLKRTIGALKARIRAIRPAALPEDEIVQEMGEDPPPPPPPLPSSPALPPKTNAAATLHSKAGAVLQTWDWKGRMVRISPPKDRQIVQGKKEQLAQCVADMEKRVERLCDVLGKTPLARGEAKGARNAREKEEKRKALQKEAVELRKKYTAESATCVQSVFRGNLARRKMRRAKAKYDNAIRHEGAIAIQNRFRGFMARKEIAGARERMREAQKEGSALVIQSSYRRRIARRKFRQAKTGKERRIAGAMRIQAWWRGCVGRFAVSGARKAYRDTLERAAALLVQSAWRGRVARKRAARLRAEKARDMEEAAAIMVQAQFRGHRARKLKKALMKKLDATEDKLAKMWFDKLEQSGAYAKYFLNPKERAAISIQSLARGFKERKRVARYKKKKENDRLRELEERRNKKEMDREIERKLRDAEREKQRVDDLLRQAEAEKDGVLVHSGECILPIKHAVSGTNSFTSSAIRVNVTVREIQSPYQMRFKVEEPNASISFKRAIDAVALEQLLKPMFSGNVGVDDLSEIDRGMHRWVTTGRPPQRRFLIAWLLDRMWLDEDAQGRTELCLGHRSIRARSESAGSASALAPAVTKYTYREPRSKP